MFINCLGVRNGYREVVILVDVEIGVVGKVQLGDWVDVLVILGGER